MKTKEKENAVTDTEIFDLNFGTRLKAILFSIGFEYSDSEINEFKPHITLFIKQL